MHIIMMGKPGSGKGTIGAMLEGYLGVPHISTGDLLRADPVTADKAATGELIDDNILFALVRDRLIDKDARDGWVLDGFPRTERQAHWALTTLAPFTVVNLNIPDSVVKKRISERGRADDTEEIFEIRMREYYSQTAPALEILEPFVITVSSNSTPEKVFAKVTEALQESMSEP